MKFIRTITWLFLISFILPLQVQTFSGLFGDSISITAYASESDCIEKSYAHIVTGKVEKILTDERVVSLTTDAGKTILFNMYTDDEPDKYTPFLGKTVRTYYRFSQGPFDKKEGYCPQSNYIAWIETVDPNYTDDCIYKMISSHSVIAKVEKISTDDYNPFVTLVTDAGETISVSFGVSSDIDNSKHDTVYGSMGAYTPVLGENVKVEYNLVQYPFTEMEGYCPQINELTFMAAASEAKDEKSSYTACAYTVSRHTVTGKIEKVFTDNSSYPSADVVTDAGETIRFRLGYDERDESTSFQGKTVKIKYDSLQPELSKEGECPKYNRMISMTTTDSNDVQSYTNECIYGTISRHILTGKAEKISHNDNMDFLDIITDAGETKRFQIGYREHYKYIPLLGKTVKVQHDLIQQSFSEHDGRCPQSDEIRAIATIDTSIKDCVYGKISSHSVTGTIEKIFTDEAKKRTHVALTDAEGETILFDIAPAERDKYTPFLDKAVRIQYDLIQHSFNETDAKCLQTNTIRSMMLQ